MASISADKNNGTKRIQFVGSDGKRHAIRLGKVSDKQAQAVCRRVEALVAAQRCGTPIDVDTLRWVTEQADELVSKLAVAGLVEPRASARLDEFFTAYLAERADFKKSTRLSYNGSRVRVLRFFDPAIDLRDITPGDADRFAIHLRSTYAQASAATTIKHIRQLFKVAMRRRLVRENPFADIVAGKQSNSARRVFVPRETADRVIETCPTNEWRLIFALSRYGGLRCPSETLRLRWEDILWDRRRMMVHASKTEHNEDCGVRAVPLFPELMPYLERAFEEAVVGQEFVITRTRDATKNFRSNLMKILKRAGVKPWPRLFQNLRASCETELTDRYPDHVVTAWIGHTKRVAEDHYLSTTEEHFRRGAECGAGVAQNAAQSATDSERPRMTRSTQPPSEREVSRILSDVVSTCQSPEISRVGILPKAGSPSDGSPATLPGGAA